MKHYRSLGCHVMRTSGSHGKFDLIAILPSGHSYFIQCKVTESESAGKRLIEGFKKDPPFKNARFTQIMEVKIKGNNNIMSWAA
jgi:hypothetical protein